MTVDLVKELRDGLVGVTPGPWMVAYDDETDCPAEIVQQDNWDNRVCFPTSNRPKDAEYLARCSPENIAALLDHIEAIRAENERLRKALEPMVRLALNYEGLPSSDAVFAKGCIYVADLRRARAVLSGGQP